MTKDERQHRIMWLRQYQDVLHEINSLEQSLAMWQDKVMAMTHQPTYFKYHDAKAQEQMTKEERRLNAMPPVIVRGNAGLSMEDAICNADVVAGKINERIEVAKSILFEIELAIQGLEDGRVRSVMRYRYVNGMKWEEICMKMPCSWNSVHRWHRNGLIHLRTLSHT